MNSSTLLKLFSALLMLLFFRWPDVEMLDFAIHDNTLYVVGTNYAMSRFVGRYYKIPIDQMPEGASGYDVPAK